jgi:thioredoxin 1
MESRQMRGTRMKDKIDCETFSESNFQEEVKDSKMPVLAVFEADWSGTCHIMTPILEDLCRQFKGRAKIGIIDIDADAGLAEDFGVINIPSLVFFNNGEIVDHISGSVSKNVIAARLNDIVTSIDE